MWSGCISSLMLAIKLQFYEHWALSHGHFLSPSITSVYTLCSRIKVQFIQLFFHSFFNDHTCWHCSVCSGCLSSCSLLKILFQWHNLNTSSSLWAAICKTDVNKMLQDAPDCLMLSRLIISLSVSESVLKIPQNHLLILGLKKECFWCNPVFI